MGSTDIGTLAQGLGADHSQGDSLIPVVVVDLIAGLDLHAGSKGLKPVFFCFGNSRRF